MTRLLDLFGAWPVLLDGGWATELQKAGLPVNTPGDIWNLTNPDAVRAVARGYVEAGSQLILTNTFRANSISLSDVGLGDQMARINQEGVRISRESADEGTDVRIFGSIGPVLFRGPIPTDQRVGLREVFFAQARALADAGVQGIALETFGDLEEAELALDAALTTEVPVVASFAFVNGLVLLPKPSGSNDLKPGAQPINIGVVARRMETLGASAIGTNCMASCKAADLARALARDSGLPVWVKPNGGIGRASVTWGMAELDDFSIRMTETISAGASLVGGCCGSTPEHIRAIKQRVVAPILRGRANR